MVSDKEVLEYAKDGNTSQLLKTLNSGTKEQQMHWATLSDAGRVLLLLFLCFYLLQNCQLNAYLILGNFATLRLQIWRP